MVREAKKDKVVAKKRVPARKKEVSRKAADDRLTKKPPVKQNGTKAVKGPKAARRIVSQKKRVETLRPVSAESLQSTVLKPQVRHPAPVIADQQAIKERPPVERKPLPVQKAKEAQAKVMPAQKEKEAGQEKALTGEPKVTVKQLELDLPITVKDLAIKLQEKSSVLIKALMGMGIMAGINQVLEESVVARACQHYGYQMQKAPNQEELALRMHQKEDKAESLLARPPIVTLMGHVDHGKTSLLDAIRKTKVVESEHGSITQHIGAYRVVLPHGEITFLDTPGHEAFTAMRARGASITDIVILVVAADDGIMPQTQEAIDHARAAGVSIIVAINKVDKAQANVDRVKKQLAEYNLTPEGWGGKTITCPLSAKTGQGIDELLEMVLLEAQMLELKANPLRPASGVVVEAKLSKGRGPVATLLVRNGTLHLNENIICGRYCGKVRAMFNDRGQAVDKAGVSFPVEVLGLSGVPSAGEQFFAIADEKIAREIALIRQEKERQQQIKSVKRISLEDLHAQIKEGKLKELKLIIKADVQGSLGAIREILNKVNSSEIRLDIIHEAVGNINTSDAVLALASNALIMGFNIIVDGRAKELIAKEGIDARTYNIIYELANDIKAALEGMLEPKLKKILLGKAEVRKVFKLSRSGAVAGCFVNKGKVTRSAVITLVRNGQTVLEGKISSLKRFKDDVREVLEGFECGIALAPFEDFKEGDMIEAYEIEKIARKLD